MMGKREDGENAKKAAPGPPQPGHEPLGSPDGDRKPEERPFGDVAHG